MSAPARRSPGRTAAALLLAAGLVLSAAACRDRTPPAGETGDKPSAEALSALKPDRTFPGTILFQSDADGDDEIYALTGGGLRKLTDNVWSDTYPRWSPDGTRIAFAADPRGNYDIFVMSADGTGARAVTGSPADETEPAWLPDGAGLAFTRGNALWTIDFSSGAERRVLPDFRPAHRLSDFARTGEHAAFTGHRTLGWDVFALDPARGAAAPLTDGGRSCRPRFSPDGRTIAFVSTQADGNGDIWLMAPDGSGKTRLTERAATVDYFPAWSPDGRAIVFCSGVSHSPRRGRWGLFLVDVATKAVSPLFSAFERALFPDWK